MPPPRRAARRLRPRCHPSGASSWPSSLFSVRGLLSCCHNSSELIVGVLGDPLWYVRMALLVSPMRAHSSTSVQQVRHERGLRQSPTCILLSRQHALHQERNDSNGRFPLSRPLPISRRLAPAATPTRTPTPQPEAAQAPRWRSQPLCASLSHRCVEHRSALYTIPRCLLLPLRAPESVSLLGSTA